ncbi:MAG: hypothetical protein MUE55_05330 [Thermoplasmata archaeon]|jgi:DNA repair exonuclease SbcCD ATPase subunit/RNA polymerase subunit RPABC4/transcription elongation factor Spt4|nr:hypothetical protein [Thermoplasmata archaeon]
MKGVIKTGEMYCLECNEQVASDVEKCPSCGSDLHEETKAFVCPRCRSILSLGTPQCPKCNMRFKIRAVAQKPAEDEKLLVKLIEMEKPPAEGGAEASPSPENVGKLAILRASVEDLVKNRSEMLRRMEKRLEEEKSRLARIQEMEGRSPTTEHVEAEIEAIAEEMADIAVLQTHMSKLADEITRLIEAFEVSQATRDRGLAAKALRHKLDQKEREIEDLRSKEEELVKREEMVDRKIKAYAAKKKQLDEQEQGLESRLKQLEEERSELQRLKAQAAVAVTSDDRHEAEARWEEEQRRLRHRLIDLRSVVSPPSQPGGTEARIEAAEADLDGTISQLSEEIRRVLSTRAELETKIKEAEEADEDLKKLLKVLDDMLGQLPQQTIDKFSGSEHYAVYERVLKRLNI